MEIEKLIGKTFTSIEQHGDEEIIFTDSEGVKYKMYHSQQCCEDVRIDDVIGDLNDLVETPILMAEEIVNEGESGSSTWTFYKFATIKGYVTIKWFGESNGYYSESVDFLIVESELNWR